MQFSNKIPYFKQGKINWATMGTIGTIKWGIFLGTGVLNEWGENFRDTGKEKFWQREDGGQAKDSRFGDWTRVCWIS